MLAKSSFPIELYSSNCLFTSEPIGFSWYCNFARRICATGLVDSGGLAFYRIITFVVICDIYAEIKVKNHHLLGIHQSNEI